MGPYSNKNPRTEKQVNFLKNWSNFVGVCTHSVRVCMRVDMCVHAHTSFICCEVCTASVSFWFYESCPWFAPPPTPRTQMLIWQSAFNYFWASPECIDLYSQVLVSNCLIPFSFLPATASCGIVCCWVRPCWPTEDIPKLPTTLFLRHYLFLC